MSDKEQPNPSPTESIKIIRHQKAERNRAELARKKNALLILDILAGQDLSYSECEATLNTALSALKHYSVLPLISSKKLHDSFSHKHNAEGGKERIMTITISGTPKEITALVLEIQGRRIGAVGNDLDITTNYAMPLTRTKSGVISGNSQDA